MFFLKKDCFIASNLAIKKKYLTALKPADLCLPEQGRNVAFPLLLLFRIWCKSVLKNGCSQSGAAGVLEKPPLEPHLLEPSPPLQHGPLSVSTWFLGVWTYTLTWMQQDCLALHRHQSVAIILEWQFFLPLTSWQEEGDRELGERPQSPGVAAIELSL